MILINPKCKTVIKCPYKKERHPEMLNWVNDNSNGLVDMVIVEWAGDESIYVGFENEDDSIFFKIKYSV
jgi:hypothetical protein